MYTTTSTENDAPIIHVNTRLDLSTDGMEYQMIDLLVNWSVILGGRGSPGKIGLDV